MSDAVYNEVIALVAQTEKFEASVNELQQFWANAIDKIASDPLQLPVRFDKEAIQSIDEYIDRQRAERDQVRQINELYKERVRLLKEAEDVARGAEPKVDVTSANLSRGERYDLKKKIVASTDINTETDALRAQVVAIEKTHRLAAEREVRETALQSAKMVGEATRKNEIDSLARRKTERDAELAALKNDIIAREKANVAAFTNAVHNEEQLNIANSVRVAREDARIRKEEAVRKAQLITDTHNAEQLAKLKVNAESDVAAKRTKQAAIDKAALSSQLHQREAADVVAAKMSQYRMSNELNVAIEIATRRKIIAQFETDEAKRKASIEKQAVITKSTVGYKVGSTIAGGKVGAGFDIAAGGAFALGATNLGGTIYMAERAAYALGIGQKTLGEFAEKLGFVKLKGEGAEASIARFGKVVLGLGAVAATAGTALAVLAAGNKLDNELASMSTLLADATVKGDEFNKMMGEAKDSAIALSNSFNTDVEEVVRGFKTALSTGIDASELETFGSKAMIVAKGLGTTFEDATSILTTFKDAYGTGVSEMAHFSDVLFNAINVGKFQVNDLKQNIGRVLTSAAEAGVGVEDMMSALATLTRVGMTTSQSITSLNSLIVGIVNPTDKAAAMFDKLGLATGSAALANKTLLEYLNEVRDATAGNKDLIGDLFGEERARRGAIGLTANLALAASVRGEMDKVGTATIAANRAMNTFSTNMGKLWNSIINPIKSIGEWGLTKLNNILFPALVEQMSITEVKSVDMSAKMVDSASAITKAYGELEAAMEKAGKKGVTAFDTLLEKQSEYYKRITIDRANQDFYNNNKPTGVPTTSTEVNMRNRFNEVRLAREDLAAKGYSGGDYAEMKHNEKLKEYDDEMQKIAEIIASLVKLRNERATSYKEDYEYRRKLNELNAREAIGEDVTFERAALERKKQMSKMDETQRKAMEAADAARVQAGAHNKKVLDDLFEGLRKVSTGVEAFRKLDQTATQDQIQNANSVLAAMQKKYDRIQQVLGDTETLTDEQREHYTNLSKIYLKEIEDEQAKITTLVATRYKREYEAAEAAYNKKMAFYNKEEDKINSIIKKIMEQKNALQQSIIDRTANLRGPDYARRQYREQIEVGTRNAGNIKDPLQQIEAIEKLRDLINKFVSASDASGNGARGAREASDMEALLIKLDERALARQKEAWKTNEGMKQTAGMARNVAEADNPVAQAMRSEAQRLIKDTLSEAAKYGMTVSGDYKVDVDKITVEVKGIEKATVERMVEAGVLEGIKKYIHDKENNGPLPTDGFAPVGAKTDWSNP